MNKLIRMTLPQGIPQSKLKTLTPATLAVLEALGECNSMTASELMDETGYALRTIRYSLKDLHDKGLVKKRINLLNMKTIEYQLSVMTSTKVQKETRLTKIQTEKLKSSISDTITIK